ncbi:hypothetical protein D3C87_1300080 [compost metagenome]
MAARAVRSRGQPGRFGFLSDHLRGRDRRCFGEFGDIAANRELNAQGFIDTRTEIVLIEKPPQPAGLHPHDRIGLGIKIRGAAEDVNSNGIGLDRLRIAIEATFDDIAQEFGKLRRARNIGPGKQAIQRPFYLPRVCHVLRHPETPATTRLFAPLYM